MAKFATNVSGAMLLPSSIQVTESIPGSVVPLAMFTSMFIINVAHQSGKFNEIRLKWDIWNI